MLRWLVCAVVMLAAEPSTGLAQDSTTATTHVVLAGDPAETACAIWLSPVSPIWFERELPLDALSQHAISREFSFTVVNGRDVATNGCVVTVGGDSLSQDENYVQSIHTVKLSQARQSDIPVYLVPRVNSMTANELQAILIKHPVSQGTAIVCATVSSITLTAASKRLRILGTLTLTMSTISP